MKLDLSEIARILGKRYHYEIDEPPIVDDTVVCAEPIRGEIDFSNTGSLLIARGRFATSVQLECSRCLKTFTVPVTAEIDEGFPIPVPSDSEEELAPEIEEEQEPESLFVENMLDLTELIRQSIILAVPIRPLCEVACKGICPSCGQNLNEAQCGCEPEPDLPLSDLAERWKQRQAEEKDN